VAMPELTVERLDLVSMEIGDFVSTDLAVPRWAVEGIWPEGASGVIAGRPKDGKSTVAVELAISLWSRTPMFGEQAFPTHSRPAPILYIQQENATDRVQRDLQHVLASRGLGQIEEEPLMELPDGSWETLERFELLPYPYSDLPAFTVLSNQQVDLSQQPHRDWLEECIHSRGYRYLFLDPLYMLVGATKITDGGDDLRPILTWLRSLASDTGCGIIFTHHMTNARGSGNDASSMMGTTFLHAWYMRRRSSSVRTTNVEASSPSRSTPSAGSARPGSSRSSARESAAGGSFFRLRARPTRSGAPSRRRSPSRPGSPSSPRSKPSIRTGRTRSSPTRSTSASARFAATARNLSHPLAPRGDS
jgi:AAA domain